MRCNYNGKYLAHNIERAERGCMPNKRDNRKTKAPKGGWKAWLRKIRRTFREWD